MLYTIGAAQDTVRRAVTLPAVSVIQTNSRPETIKAQTPTQVATSEKIERLGDAQLSDVLRRMVGVTLKDYGGLGGIKTVSARGLGSQFSTLTIDGVAPCPMAKWIIPSMRQGRSLLAALLIWRPMNRSSAPVRSISAPG